MMQIHSHSNNSMRLDKWLWNARLFKTRTLAAEQCSSGKVKRLGASLKPSTPIKVGDHLAVPSNDGKFKREIEILILLDKRVGAQIAHTAYRDNTPEEVIIQAQKQKTEQKESRNLRKSGDQGRMNKKQRRDWRKGLGSNKN